MAADIGADIPEPVDVSTFPRLESDGAANLRAVAERRLRRVMDGALPEPVRVELSRAMAQVAFAARSIGLVNPDGPPEVVAPVFCALLAHPDLPAQELEWVTQDAAVAQPSVLAALLEHPNATLDVTLSAARHTLWSFRGAFDVDEWTFKHPLIRVLQGQGGLAGRVVAALIPAWSGCDWESFADVARRLHTGGEPALEVFVTLAADARQGRRQRTYQLPAEVLETICRQAVLLSQ